ncbi:ABC transporter ATP-binding protein [Desulfosporosinus meridiei]|uniref:ABC-type multidrug transport system, ATPase component n=1 Tax=Desulfosporosinus meridiei (strain ATCC BAA-275 / DSM 13257 / KCTC 12902 / NCIMB 13706 / S10) TaxID=768704 RepID=J7J144_DESMD|nr:ABC transporter ATP-binding protein [Desulfosporosinus meridiei]AFQ45033.1 ABC-type multidrug transport system, ATPase component [Desulfosporosinus meridiei DSM 13257]
MQETAVLELTNLSKTIKGKDIVKGINLTLQSSQIYGFLGPNGAGKTTTIRMIVGLIKPTQGTVKICGHSVAHEFVKALSNVGCIIESPDMYQYLTGMENLLQFAGMNKTISHQRIKDVIEMVGLKHRVNDKVSTYSLGMRQRLGIAQAIISKPKLLILDEPTNGLDPAGITEFRNLIRKLAYEEGMTVFVSSHILLEIQQMCDMVSIIKQGSVVKTANVQDLLQDNDKIEWQLSDPDAAISLLREHWSIQATQLKKNTISANIGQHSLEKLNEFLISQGLALTYCSAMRNTLEDLFLDLTVGDEIV